MFRLQYSIERISVDIGDTSTIQCALYSTFAAKYRAQYPVYAMPSLFPGKSNIITVLLVQASIFIWMYLRCDWWIIDKSMRVILHICCQIQSTISGVRYAISGPGQMPYIYNSSSSGCNIPLNVNPTMLVILRQSNVRYTPHSLPNAGQIGQITLRQHWSQSIPIQLQFSSFRLQYSIERICAAIGGV
jgi:hypothetical protein